MEDSPNIGDDSRQIEDDNIGISSHDKAVLNRIFNPNLPYNEIPEEIEDQNNYLEPEQETEVVKQAREFELQGVQAAEQGNVEEALTYFEKAIGVAPERPSGYNNRAQALRLNGNVQGALQDLNQALELSDGKGAAAKQAFTQRGLIRRFEGDDEGSIADFKQASALGCGFAKKMCVLLNPYAALCNQMVMDMIKTAKGETHQLNC